jgi:hypothetical protein
MKCFMASKTTLPLVSSGQPTSLSRPEVSFLTSVKSDNATNTTFIWDDRVWGLGYHDPDKVSFFTGYYESRCPVETI